VTIATFGAIAPTSSHISPGLSMPYSKTYTSTPRSRKKRKKDFHNISKNDQKDGLKDSIFITDKNNHNSPLKFLGEL